jgi:hypothetical protein
MKVLPTLFALAALFVATASARTLNDIGSNVPPGGYGLAPGSTCRSVNPNDFVACCAKKLMDGVVDSTCPSPPPPSPSSPPHSSSPTQSPLAGASCGLLAQSDVMPCCYAKGRAGEKDDFCIGKPVAGLACSASANIEDHATCCAAKAAACPPKYDPTCPSPSSPTPAPVVKTCASASPTPLAAAECCDRKRNEGVKDATCPTPSPSPSPFAPGSCGANGPLSFNYCCIKKKLKGVEDASCAAETCGLLAQVDMTEYLSECCFRKGAAGGMRDLFCTAEPDEAMTCSSWPDRDNRKICCADKANVFPPQYDPTCLGEFAACTF